MKNGRDFRDLLVEVDRIAKNKKDYVVRAQDLRFLALRDEIEAVLAGPSTVTGQELVTVDGGRHQADANWWHGRLQDAVKRNGLAPRLAPATTTLAIPRKDGERTIVGVNGLANDQLATYLGIPGRFYDRLREDHPALLSDTVNTLLAAQPAKEYRMVRTLDGMARAVLSDSYEPLDNYDLLKWLLPLFYPKDREHNLTVMSDGTVIRCLLGPDGQPLVTKLGSCEVTENKLYIKMMAPQITAELKVGTVLRAGVIIQNSEVGLGAVSVFPFYEVLACTNGAFITNFGNTRRHVGRAKGGDVNVWGDGNDASRFYTDVTKRTSDKAFFLQMADVVRGTLTEATFKRMLIPIREAMNEKIEGSVEGAIEIAGRMFDVGEEAQDDIMRYLIDGGDLSRFGFSNAFTRYSQDIASYDEATRYEGIGGNIITLPATEWKVIATATKKRKPVAAGRR